MTAVEVAKRSSSSIGMSFIIIIFIIGASER